MTKRYYQDLNMHSMYFDITSPDLVILLINLFYDFFN